MSRRRVVVVGGGFAGAAAAHALAAAGCAVTVLEARERLGGRVSSTTLGDAVVERGAEFVLPGEDVVRRLCAEAGLTLWEKGTQYGEREPRGAGTTAAEVRAAREVVAATLAAGARGTVREVLDAADIPPGAREAICARIEISSTGAASGMDVGALIHGVATSGPYASFSVQGGNQRLAERLVERAGADVRLGAAVSHVTEEADGGLRVDAGGVPVSADAVVVTVPASVIGRIAFTPALPAATVRALAAVRYGEAAKLSLALSAPLPPSGVMSVPGRFWTWTQHPQPGTRDAVASSFAGGAGIVADLAVADGPGAWAARVRALRPELAYAEQPEPLLTTWHDDPWVRGSYSLDGPDGELGDPALSAPVGRVAFAGEHTAGRERHASMEGALRSGLRAADDVLAILGT